MSVRVRAGAGDATDQLVSGVPVGGEDVQRVSPTNPNRVDASFRAIQVAAITTEALASLTPNRGGAADGVAAASHVPTAGKNFVLLAMMLQVRNTGTAAIVPVEMNLRWSTGALGPASPILASIGAANAAATLQTMGFAVQDFGPGLIIPAGVNFGVSHVSRNTVNATLNLVLSGYEYTP